MSILLVLYYKIVINVLTLLISLELLNNNNMHHQPASIVCK